MLESPPSPHEPLKGPLGKPFVSTQARTPSADEYRPREPVGSAKRGMTTVGHGKL